MEDAQGEGDVVAASRHEHLVVYDPAAIPPGTPFDPDMETGEPDPLPAAALEALATAGNALVLHFPVEDCEAGVRIVVGLPPPHARERGRLVLDRARLRLPGGKAIGDGAEFIHDSGHERAHAQERATSVPPGDYAVSVLNLVPWKLANRDARLQAATTPAARRIDKLTTVIGLTGAVLVPLTVLGLPAALGIAWQYGSRRLAMIAAGIVLVDALVLAAAAILQAVTRRRPALGAAHGARNDFERENPDVIVILEPWTGGEARAAWAKLDWK